MAANVLFEPQYSYAMDQSGTLVGQGAGGSQSGRDPRLRGILICLARSLNVLAREMRVLCAVCCWDACIYGWVGVF
eukprot:1973630-Rhodomonas_salina.1